MTRIVSLFNHKGGVSKTTTAFNLGWMLAEQGRKTLLVDADPQCNLTTLVLDYDSVEDTEEFYQSHPRCDIASGLQPIMQGSLSGLNNGNPIQTSNCNLFIYCGNLMLSEFETQISVALTTSQAIPAIRNIPGSANELLRRTGNQYDFDYVIIDMSPSVGALNQCLLMSSDFFIVPTAPDFFCAQAVRSLATVIPRWNIQVQPFRDSSIDYRFPSTPPRFLGFISQRYRPRGGAPAKSFQRWIDVIKETVNNVLIPKLQPLEMTIDLNSFTNCIANDEPYNLANIADFNSLIAQSQKYKVPVFALSDMQIEQTGNVLENMKENRSNFRKVFSTLASEMHSLIETVQR